MFQGIKLIIYDLDGVLIDSNRGILESFRLTMEELNEPFDPNIILNRIGYSLYRIFQDIMPIEYHSKLEDLRQIYIKHFQSLDISYISLLPEVSETLSIIEERGFLQAIATNKTASEAERKLSELKISKYFDAMAGFMTVDKPKPDPDMILYLLDKLEIKTNETVFVDDTSIGLKAGIKAGVITIGITTGNNTLHQIQKVKPDAIINRLSDLPSLLA